MEAYIKAISSFLPQSVLTNQELVMEFPEWSEAKIIEKIGVDRRHIAHGKETATDLAIQAAKNLFKDHPSILKESIDFVLLCTQSPDYFLPTSACIIQSELGLRFDIGALDFNLGCSGYVYGLSLAKGLIIAGIAQNVLLLTAETYSKYIHPRDKGNRTIFGDAATATVVSTAGFAEIGNFILGTDGRGANNLIVRNGATRNPQKTGNVILDESGNPVSDDFLYMNGSEIFSFTQKNVPMVVRDTLAKNNMNMDDVDIFIFHQANSYMLEFLRKKINIPKDKFYIDMLNCGNTVSNSIPLAMIKSQKDEKLHGNVCLCGFGVGYSWGGCVLRVK